MYKNEEWVHFLISTDYKGTYIYEVVGAITIPTRKS